MKREKFDPYLCSWPKPGNDGSKGISLSIAQFSGHYYGTNSSNRIHQPKHSTAFCYPRKRPVPDGSREWFTSLKRTYVSPAPAVVSVFKPDNRLAAAVMEEKRCGLWPENIRCPDQNQLRSSRPPGSVVSINWVCQHAPLAVRRPETAVWPLPVLA